MGTYMYLPPSTTGCPKKYPVSSSCSSAVDEDFSNWTAWIYRQNTEVSFPTVTFLFHCPNLCRLLLNVLQYQYQYIRASWSFKDLCPREWSPGPGTFSYSIRIIPRGLFGAMNHRQFTHHSAFDERVKQHWVKDMHHRPESNSHLPSTQIGSRAL